MRSRLMVVCLGAVTALAVGCSSGDDDVADTLGAQGDAPDDQRSDAQRQTDQAAAEAMVLTLDDVPAGYQADPPDEDDDDDAALDAQMAQCLDVDPAVIDPDNPKAESPDFSTPDGDQISSEVSIAPSVEAAEKAIDLLRSDAMPGCYAAALQALAAQATADDPSNDAELGEPTVAPISFPDLGDDAEAFRVTVPIETQGRSVELYVDAVEVRVGRVGIGTTFTSAFSPYDTDEAVRMTQIVVDRVPADISE
jgi:hypothetical protein